MMTQIKQLNADKSPLFRFVLGLADDSVVLSHRLSEWCSNGPYLEEDIALSNVALDYIGRASHTSSTLTSTPVDSQLAYPCNALQPRLTFSSQYRARGSNHFSSLRCRH